jgi:hypothetical protein
MLPALLVAATAAADVSGATASASQGVGVRPDAARAQADSSWTVPALHGASTLLAMRTAASVLWPRAYDPTRVSDQLANLGRAFTAPPEFRRDRPLLQSDGDPWAINVFGHAAFGSEIYARTRACGHGPVAAFAATAAASVAWEYVLEAPYKRPSALDLAWTPVVGGLLVGELRFRAHHWLSGSGNVLPAFLRDVLMISVDPFGELERRVFHTRC